MVDLVRGDDALWTSIPERFEPGSPNLAGVVGFAAAADYLSAVGLDCIAAHSNQLAHQAATALADVPGLRLLPRGGDAARSCIVSFKIDGVHPHDIAQIAAELVLVFLLTTA